MASKRSKGKAAVEKFLSAPEEVVADESELKKIQDRKARDAARVERERASKSKDRPTLEDILGDVVRVAEDEETNPYHEFRSISRRRYELYGHYPIEYVLEHGRFEHVKKMAGLVPTVGDQRLLHARTLDSLREHDQRYFQRYLWPYVDQFPELKRATDQSKLVAWISDTHSLFMDPFTWLAFLDFLDHAQPDVVVWGGDHIDGSEISTHPKPYGFSTKLQVELDFFRAMLEEAREVCPRARFVWTASNHWTDRIVRHLTQTDPALANLRSMRIDKQLNLDNLDIELAHGGSFLAPPGQEDDVPRATLWEQIQVTHGTKTGKFPAMAELLEWVDMGLPKGSHGAGISGHVHRFQQVVGPHSGLRHMSWTCAHGAVIDEVAKYYVKGNRPAWSRGFVIAEKGRRAVNVTGVDTTLGECFANGWSFEKKGRYPNGVEDTRKFWLRRYKQRMKSYEKE